MVELHSENAGMFCLACSGCLFPCLVCVSDGPVPIADAVGSTSGFKTSLASASFI
ncbi:hypothetical protein HNP65_001396 [Thermosipho japonicus]|uniref:Uncharacterized protein n=1 Tax=Thermosipho japonicus TaxID=90323 RepID=A0A841GP34_9BACT|nr:hypothetical protein [Thermosipho japonicus]